MDLARLGLEQGAGAFDHIGRSRVEGADLLQHELLVGHRLSDGYRGSQRGYGRRRGAIDALHQLDIVLLDEIERQITLNGHRHLGQQIRRALARVEQGRLADRLRLCGLRGVQLVGLLLELGIERLRNMDHLLELAHRLPHLGALGVDRGIVLEQLILARGQGRQNFGDVGLRRLIFHEIAAQFVTERNNSEQSAGTGQIASCRIERFDRLA